MKKLSILIPCFILLLSGVFNSCKKTFLTRLPQGTVDTSALANKVGVNVLLVGAYAALAGQDYDADAGNIQSLGGGNAWACSPSNWLWGSVAGGDAHKGSDGGDQISMVPVATFTISPGNDLINDRWKAVYEGITRCNNVLRVLPKVINMTRDELINTKAQARFLRGHYYFELKKMFNNLPWIDETTVDLLQPNTMDIWPKIEADFQFAYDSLPASQSDIGRANKWAAGAYLAKTYLYEKKYTEADPIFTDVINNGQTPNGIAYDLNPVFEDNRRPSQETANPEAIFVVEMAANVGTGNIANSNQGDMLNFPYTATSYPFGCCGFFQPSIDLVNSFRTDANGLPYLDDYNSHAVTNDQGLLSTDAFTPDAGNLDPRLDWTVGRRGIPYLDYGLHPGNDWIRAQGYAGPFSPIKNVYWNADATTDGDNSQWAPGSSINVFIIRFADVLLMAAEVKAQLNQFDDAEAYVNRVRLRMADKTTWVHSYVDDLDPSKGFSNTLAANYKISPYDPGAFASQDFALKAIYFERKLELGMEGYRYFDLVRWGQAATALNNFFQYESQYTTDLHSAKFTANKNEYFPIPLGQIDLTEKNGKATLTQNQGYK
ncbi:RagB/SusD family nutrient uptake outer membrane protein [Flavitalea flava]